MLDGKRRNYYIKKDFQGRFIIKFCMLMVVSFFFLSVVIYMASTTSVTSSFEKSRLVLKTTADFILPILGLATCMMAMMVGMAVIYMVKRISHSIAGPVYRIELQTERIAAGNLAETVRLRGTDQMQDLAEKVNHMIGSLRERIDALKKAFHQMEKHAAGIHNQELIENVKKIKDELNKFKTN